jgi:hypothetical protein
MDQHKHCTVPGADTYSGLEVRDFLISKSVGLSNDGDKVDFGVEASHDFNIQRLERVAGGLDEKHACVDAVVHDVHTVDLVLGIEVGIVPLLDVVNNWSPGLVIVHKVAKTRSVNHGQSETNTGLLDIGADGLDGDGLRNNVQAWSLALLGRVQRGVEESVDKCRLAEAGFTCRSESLVVA